MIINFDQLGRDEGFAVGAQLGGHALEEQNVTGRVGRRGEQKPPGHRREVTDNCRAVAFVRARRDATGAGDRESTGQFRRRVALERLHQCAQVVAKLCQHALGHGVVDRTRHDSPELTAEVTVPDRPEAQRRNLPEWVEAWGVRAGDHDHQRSSDRVRGDEGQYLGAGRVQPVGVVDGGADRLHPGDAAEQREHSGGDRADAGPGFVDQAERGLQCREMCGRQERAVVEQLSTEQVESRKGDLLLGGNCPNPEHAEAGSLIDHLVQGC
ncbi:hypothetical protein [Micromonospora sp. WMMC250]|uniref:hypothetical protein n=1 Tax=Micromonospora sp. WMMC250 TaxID=3014781 RepID=UPI0022B74F65|nr:hypothetical protein [Micromonospora sp. WMMC250]MCZ7373358.1 hypothetical protein [Micromonospora sp. WMMC250]